MKKYNLIAAGLISMMLGACSAVDSEPDFITFEDGDLTSQEIFFNTDLMSTRGTELNQGNIAKIYVTALTENDKLYFKDVEFDRDSKTGKYVSQNGTYYWPGFHSLKFFAYTPSKGDLQTSGDNDNGLLMYEVQPQEKISEQYDFATAYSKGDKDKTDGVPLLFEHRMAQIEIKAKNTNAAYTYYILGVKLANFKSNFNYNLRNIETDDDGNLKYDDPTWETNGVISDFTITYTQNIVELDGKATNNLVAKSLMGGKVNAFMIPQTLTAWDKDKHKNGAYIGVLMRIVSNDGSGQIYPDLQGHYAWAAIPISYTLEEGHKYVFTLDFSEGAGYVAPAETFNGKGDHDGPLDQLVDNSLSSPKKDGGHLGEAILGGVVGVMPEVLDKYSTEEHESDWKEVK